MNFKREAIVMLMLLLALPLVLGLVAGVRAPRPWHLLH
jgi:hypothetical protein